ncbi:MAG: glycerophosphodiester phosphodiesterase, partial [Lachnospiraceae bacterium]|nr:glycerophosphodiester phosphodiesterase [Lachnospiraceae bacterium]
YKLLSTAQKEPIVISFYDDVLEYLRERDVDIQLQKIVYSLTNSKFEKCKEYNWDIDMDYEYVTSDIVKKVQKAGLKLNVWTVNNRNIARLLYKWGVNYISTDNKFF